MSDADAFVCTGKGKGVYFLGLYSRSVERIWTHKQIHSYKLTRLNSSCLPCVYVLRFSNMLRSSRHSGGTITMFGWCVSAILLETERWSAWNKLYFYECFHHFGAIWVRVSTAHASILLVVYTYFTSGRKMSATSLWFGSTRLNETDELLYFSQCLLVSRLRTVTGYTHFSLLHRILCHIFVAVVVLWMNILCVESFKFREFIHWITLKFRVEPI